MPWGPQTLPSAKEWFMTLLGRADTPERRGYDALKGDPELGEAYKRSAFIQSPALNFLTHIISRQPALAESFPTPWGGLINVPPGQQDPFGTAAHEVNHINNGIRGYAQEPQDMFFHGSGPEMPPQLRPISDWYAESIQRLPPRVGIPLLDEYRRISNHVGSQGSR